MVDVRYITPQYDSTFEKTYPFADEFGDNESAFIELTYYIQKDKYKSRHGSPIDWGLRGFDSRSVFLDAIKLGELTELLKKDMRVIRERQTPCSEEFKDLIQVKELYGYELEIVHPAFTNVPIYGYINDFVAGTPISSAVVTGENAGNVFQTDFFKDTVFHVQDASVFAVGDRVCIDIACQFLLMQPAAGSAIYEDYTIKIGLIQDPAWRSNTSIAGYAPTISKIDLENNLISVVNFKIEVDSDTVKTNRTNCRIDRSNEEFFNGLNGEVPRDVDGSVIVNYLYLWPQSATIYKSYEYRDKRDDFKSVEETVSYTFDKPTNLPAYVYPHQLSGQKLDYLGRNTIPSAAEWLTRAGQGLKYIFEPPQVSFYGELGMYETRTRKTIYE